MDQELQREAAVLEVQTVSVPLVCALCLQDAKAHQLKELQCEAAVLEVYTGLYKMTELMQDSRAEVYVGTIGEPSKRAPLASFCPASRGFLAVVTLNDWSNPPFGGPSHDTLLLQNIWLGCLWGSDCILRHGSWRVFCRAEGCLQNQRVMHCSFCHVCQVDAPLAALRLVACCLQPLACSNQALLHRTAPACPAWHGILGLQQQVEARPAPPAYC